MTLLKVFRFIITAAVSGVMGLIVANIGQTIFSPSLTIFAAAALGGNLGPVLVDSFEKLAKATT